MAFQLVSGKPSISTPVRYGFAIFAISLAVGITATHFAVAAFVVEMPSDDGLETMRHSLRSAKYTLIGWGLTALTAIGLGVAVGRRKNEPTNAEGRRATGSTE